MTRHPHRSILGGLLIAAVIFPLAAGLGGCARKVSHANWQHPTLPKEEWSRDTGECRRYARREVERAAGIRTQAPADDNLGGGFASYNADMSRYELSRLQEQAFSSCMRRLGYQPIVK